MRGLISFLSACSLLMACEARAPQPQARGPAQTAPAPAAAPRPEAPPEADPAGLRELAGVHYLELVTAGARAEDELPMIIAIHGLGDTPEAFSQLLAGFDRPARVIVPRGFDPFGDGWSWFPIRMREGDVEAIAAAISAAADALAPAVEQLAAARPTRGKPIVTGFSQGGMLSFALAVEHGELISAALPVGGWLPEPLWPASGEAAASAPPIFAYHGEADDRVPHAPTKRGVEALDGLGYAIELRSYPGVGHTITSPMHADLSATLRARLDAR